MAEDVLRFSGFIEGINYVKQTAMGQTIPDFTFFLPKEKKVNMDVKFPQSLYGLTEYHRWDGKRGQ